MSRAVWIDNGTDPDPAKLRAHAITACYFDPRDRRVTASYLEAVKAEGFRPGIYFASNWLPDLDGPGLAAHLDGVLKTIGWQGNPPVCFDIEQHDPAFLVSCFTAWRKLRPLRQTDWTLEGMQGGWFTPQLTQALFHGGIGVVPQFYDGAMRPLPHSVILDLLEAGVLGSQLQGMYDAAQLPYRWHGYAFTQARLP